MDHPINKLFLILFVLSFAFRGQTQNVFNFTFDKGNLANSTPNVLEANHHYYFVQKTYLNTNTQLESVILDSVGNLIARNNLVTNSNFNIYYGFSGSLQFLSNQEFCQLYHIALDSSVHHVYFDSSLDVIRDIKFTFPFFVNPAVIKQINDSTLLTLGRVRNTSTYDLFLINTDLHGNERWRTIFGTPDNNDYGYDIEYMNNKIIVGGQTYDNNSIAHPHIYVFDNTGQLNFDTTYNDFNNGGKLAYHNQYGLYQASSINLPNGKKTALLKINPDYSLDWGKVYFNNNTFSSLSNLVINENGMITMVGTELHNNEFMGLFFQANHLGDSLGSKLIEHLPGERAAFYDIRPTSDGGYVMAGEAHTPSQDSWIVKVNAWGCDNIPCVVNVKNLENENHFNLNCYPNPSTGIGYITGLLERTYSNYGDVKIFNALGQMVKHYSITNSHFELEISLPVSGLYLVNMYQDGELVLSKKWVVR